jgi:hypothetical protein
VEHPANPIAYELLTNCRRYLPESRSRMLMSAGETPGIREACPTFSGRIFESFWRASIESELMVE